MSKVKIKVVHFSDLHFGSGERYGAINSETGLNKRFEDFILALDKVIDFSIENNVDLVIFTGDTYKHATPEPIYQQEFAKRIKKLSVNKIATILLAGNHDVLYRVDGSNALDIFSALDVDYVKVFSKIEFLKIETGSGPVQIIALPHVTKSKLLTREDYRDLTAPDQDGLMLQKVKEAINGCLEKLESNYPTILIGHGTLESASFGSEQGLSIGKVLSYPLSFFQRDDIDYVGFGHIHKHQVLQESSPKILYAGSLERVDFGEENEDKGFIYFELVKGEVSNYKFISTNPRRFITVDCDLTESIDHEIDLIEKMKTVDLKDSIVRVRYTINEKDFDKVNHVNIKPLLKDTFSCSIQPEIIRSERTYRISELDSKLISDPLLALDKYLFDRSDDEKKILIDKAKNLIEELREEIN